MVIEREITLSHIVETGTIIDASISAEMIGNIFYEGSPLHDGALILRGDRLYAAGCVLPLTQNKELNKELGTRHRAGIGITCEHAAHVTTVEYGLFKAEAICRRYEDRHNLDIYVSVSSTPFSTAGMYSRGTTPPLMASTNSKPLPGSIGSSLSTT